MECKTSVKFLLLLTPWVVLLGFLATTLITPACACGPDNAPTLIEKAIDLIK